MYFIAHSTYFKNINIHYELNVDKDNVPITASVAEHLTDPPGQDIVHVYVPLSGTTEEETSSVCLCPSRPILCLSPFKICTPFLLHATL